MVTLPSGTATLFFLVRFLTRKPFMMDAALAKQGYSLSSFFYVAPIKWRGLGVGSGIKGFFATPNNGGNNETYLFNYYHLGLGAKYYPFSKVFNRGFAFKSIIGIGQMTEK